MWLEDSPGLRGYPSIFPCRGSRWQPALFLAAFAEQAQKAEPLPDHPRLCLDHLDALELLGLPLVSPDEHGRSTSKRRGVPVHGVVGRLRVETRAGEGPSRPSGHAAGGREYSTLCLTEDVSRQGAGDNLVFFLDDSPAGRTIITPSGTGTADAVTRQPRPFLPRIVDQSMTPRSVGQQRSGGVGTGCQAVGYG